ncbi:hypothetical protein V5P93_001050 [Actinokineospora auranticolor]|uniref:hypothetical protein n=1 Tax=Actinokineospora auranticolor TaxID=155976 RepID=UPI0011AFEB33|nr:hypothetical protein [Actinokineospora auranticolor]
MLLRSTALALACLAVAGCASATSHAEVAATRPAPTTTTEAPPEALASETSGPATPEPRPGITVATPKVVPDAVDCVSYVPLISKATGTRATQIADEQTTAVCRYRLPYPRGTTNVAVFFRAEPPGTPSYTKTEDINGNTAYTVLGEDPSACGLSITLDRYLAPNQHGSHLTVLGTFETAPCATTRKITDAVFDRLADA